MRVALLPSIQTIKWNYGSNPLTTPTRIARNRFFNAIKWNPTRFLNDGRVSDYMGRIAGKVGAFYRCSSKPVSMYNDGIAGVLGSGYKEDHGFPNHIAMASWSRLRGPAADYLRVAFFMPNGEPG